MRGKWALITGATSGIGQSIAEVLGHEKGMNLILAGRREARLRDLAKSFQGKVQVETLAFDLQVRSETEAALTSVLPKIKELSVLVNNAGLASGVEPMQSANISDWDLMIDTNVKGLLVVTRFVLPYLIAQNQGKGSGHIVNLGSVAGRWTYPGGAVYAATKFAVRAISDSLRMDLMGKKIRVTNIEPGMVETEFSEVRFKGDKAKAQAVYKGLTPLSARDIAETVAWCIDRPAHVNIQELVIFPVDQVAVGASYVHREN